jgi:hypothetical protein
MNVTWALGAAFIMGLVVGTYSATVHTASTDVVAIWVTGPGTMTMTTTDQNRRTSSGSTTS